MRQLYPHDAAMRGSDAAVAALLPSPHLAVFEVPHAISEETQHDCHCRHSPPCWIHCRASIFALLIREALVILFVRHVDQFVKTKYVRTPVCSNHTALEI